MKKRIDLQEAKQLIEQMRHDRGFPSGYSELDKLSGGLVRDGVTLIAARPAMGKTSLALNLINRISQQRNGTILIYTPNIHSDEITIRLLCIGTNLSAPDFLNNKLPSDALGKRISHYFAEKKANIELDIDSFLSLDDIWDRSFRFPDLQLIVINSIEEIYEPIDFSADIINWDVPKVPREETLRSLQKLARTLNVPVLCTTNLHRSLEKRKNKRPHLGDLKKIGIPTDVADQIIFLYRDRYYDPEGEEGAELIIGKSVRGDTGTVNLDWDYTTGLLTERETE